MPAASPLADLPAQAREEIDALIERHGFRDYDGLAAAAEAMGHEGISRSALARRGRKLRAMQDRLARSTRLAQAIAQTAADAGPDRMADALVVLGQERLFDLLQALEADEIDDPETLAGLMRAVAQTADLMERARGRRAKREADEKKARKGRRRRKVGQTAREAIRKAVEGGAD